MQILPSSHAEDMSIVIADDFVFDFTLGAEVL